MSATELKPTGASLEAIQHHYDVGNEFYRLWLDPTLTYSGAMWEPGDTLETAQLRKLDYHIEQAQAAGSARVLDVGCGWGGMLRRLVETHGVAKAVGLTLSQAQADWVKGLGLPNVEVRLENWQDHRPEDSYDAIISVGAFEHFAKLDSSDEQRLQSYRAFFERCSSWLKAGGRFSLQTFAYGSKRSRENVKKTPGTQFLATEIFPETDPPSLAEIVAASNGIFEIEALRNDRKHYAATCREWVKRLKANREKAIQLTDEANVSRYQNYLQLSTVGFELGYLALFRITFSRL